MIFNDGYFMREALKEASYAFSIDEVPVGAVIVADNRIIGRGHNLTEKLTDVTAHAEIMAMTAAFEAIGWKLLSDCTLYVTLEPCAMCAGALFWARPSRIVYGAKDPKNGFTKFEPDIIHPKTKITGNILAEDSAVLLQRFFENRR